MRVLVAPQAFKGTFTAIEAAEAIAEGVLSVYPDAEIDLCPVADGGDGTLDVLEKQGLIEIRHSSSTDPLGRSIDVPWGKWKGKSRAVIEMAKVSGLSLLSKAERNPLLTTTYGLGTLILDVVRQGFQEIILGVGGSATCDGGVGMAEALGYRFLDANGKKLERGGGALSSLARIEQEEELLGSVQLTIACDVSSPLLGPQGAAALFTPQKGASPEEVRVLEEGLGHLVEVVKHDLGVDLTTLLFGGAAGGVAVAAAAFFRADLVQGSEFILDCLGIQDRIAKADLVVTGEGCVDEQTLYGKAPLSVIQRSKEVGVPVFIVVGKKRSGSELLGAKIVLMQGKGKKELSEAVKKYLFLF